MEKTKFTLFMLPAVALFLFVACSGENDMTAETPTAQQGKTPTDTAIGFDAYINRTTTRAGYAGELQTGKLQGQGFGVFAYFGNGELYNETLVPNFMYNEHVQYTDGWGYNPVKYWPNEHGSSATSTGVDRVSFFAYAPYVAVEPSSGLLTSYYDNTIGSSDDDEKYVKLTETGITWLTRNGKTGDPYVRYVTSFDPKKCVDLCYGVAKDNFTSSADGADGVNNVKRGQPYLNVAKPGTGAKIDLLFKHALAKLTMKVDADVDIPGHDVADTYADNMTRVWIRSVTFNGIAQCGFMNMKTGEWYSVMDNNKLSQATVTVHDGRRDGAEAMSSDTYEEPLGLNDELIQSSEYVTTTTTNTYGLTVYNELEVLSGASPKGVTTTNQNLFGEEGEGKGSIMVIPTSEYLRVTIVYDVETADATLPNYLSDGKTKGSTIENKITKTVTLGGSPLKLEAGKAYDINLHLGMNSVKLEADVSAWDADSELDIDLPANVPIYEASSAPYTAAAATITSAAQTFEFKVSGLNTNEAVTASPAASAPVTAVTQNSANTSGVAYETISVNENTTVDDRTITATTWAGNSSSKGVTLTLTQLAHPLGLGVSSVTSNSITLSSGALGIEWNSAANGVDKTNLATNEKVVVRKNGTALTYKASGDPDATEFTFNNGTITLATGQVNIGDIFTITVRAGDAPAETYTAHIGGIYYSPNTGTVKKDVSSGTYTVPAATLVGYGTIAYEKTTAGDDVVSGFDTDTRVATLQGTNTGDVEFTATLTPTSKPGWHYLSTTATFTLTVENE